MTVPSFAPVGVAPLLVGGLLLIVGLGAGPAAPPDEVRMLLRARSEAAQQGAPSALVVGTGSVYSRLLLADFYRQVGFAPQWLGPHGPRPVADSLLAVLRDAGTDGLRPADYHVSALDSLRRVLGAQGRRASVSSRALADFELLCTDAFLLYGAHLLGGRVDPVALVPTWTLDRRQADLPEVLRDALDSGAIRPALDRLRPSQPEYAAFRVELAHYRRLAAQGGWPSLPDGPALREGVRDDRVPLLRERLRASGELAGPPPADVHRLDAPLRRAVARFQERHGLAVDGVVGPATRRALNVPVAQRLRQIEVNMERWRWLPEDLGNPHVLVNVADYWLRVIEDGRPVLQTRAVIGTPDRPTPVFSDRISYLVFSPYWHVPPRIAAEDKLRDFQWNPALVSRLGFEVFDGWGAGARPIDPATIDWDRLSPDTFPYRLRQKPGPLNALGRVKFMFPNPHDIYLHDTPTRFHFGHTIRDFSSGCIRMEHPVELATYLLRFNRGWTEERVRAAMDGETERGVVLRRRVPVHLLYWTAWIERGALHVRPDVYQRDDAVAAALRAPLSAVTGRATAEAGRP